MSVIEQVVEELGRLPGIGPKTANRLAHHLMTAPAGEVRRLARAIEALPERVRPCRECGNYTEEERCGICRDPERDASVICVVETAFEVRSIEATGEYGGRFHVLGGRLSPLDGVGPEDLRVDGLLERVRERLGEEVEVILATSSSVEGEATAVYLEGVLKPLGARVTRLARGVPVGSDLEYVDGSTIAEALAGRREM